MISIESMKLSLSALCALTFVSASTSNAAVIVSGNVNVPGAPCTFQITSDITFNALIAGTAAGIVLDSFVSSVDSGANLSLLSPFLSYTLNGTPGGTLVGLYDNISATVGSVITPEDAYITFANFFPVIPNDTFVLKAGTYDFSGNAGFNPLAVGTYTGAMFLVDGSFQRISDPVSAGAVPEASTALLGCVGALGLLRRRR